MLRTASDCVNLSPSTVDELLIRAMEIRDLCAGAAALLREASPGSLPELVARARNASGAVVEILERELAVSAERARTHAQAGKHVATADGGR